MNNYDNYLSINYEIYIYIYNISFIVNHNYYNLQNLENNNVEKTELG